LGIKDLVSEITSILPGFSGYYEKEKRREEDKLLRDYLFKKIEDIEKKVYERIKKITKSKEMKEIEKYVSITKEIERLKDSIRYSSYEYKGFFDIVDVNEETLKEIVNVDIGLIKMVKEMKEETIDDFNSLSAFLKDFEKLFEERKKIILGYKEV
jgi:hypothetical protein